MYMLFHLKVAKLLALFVFTAVMAWTKATDPYKSTQKTASAITVKPVLGTTSIQQLSVLNDHDFYTPVQ